MNWFGRFFEHIHNRTLAGCGKSKLRSWLIQRRGLELFYERTRHSAVGDVQLLVCRGAGPLESSFACGAEAHRQDLGGAVEAVFANVFTDGAAVDCTREVAAGTVVAGVVHGAERADADGAVGLQHAVSVVRWPEPGRGSVGC